MKQLFIIAAVACCISGVANAADEPNLASQYTDLPLQSSINGNSPPASATEPQPSAPAAPQPPAVLSPLPVVTPQPIPVVPPVSMTLPVPPNPPASTPPAPETTPAAATVPVTQPLPTIAPVIAPPTISTPAPVLSPTAVVGTKPVPEAPMPPAVAAKQTLSTAVAAPQTLKQMPPAKSINQSSSQPTASTDLAKVFGKAPHKANAQIAYDFASVAFPEPSYAGGTENAVVNIKASEVLGRMDKQYHNLQSFSADVEMQSSDNKSEPVMDASVLFQRNPERAIANVTGPNPATYIYDGDYIFLYPAPDAQHFMRTENVWNNLAGSGIGTVFGRLVDDPKYDVLSRLVTSGFKSQVDLGDYEDLGMMPPILADGIMCDRVRAKIGTGSVVLLVGRIDHLLRRIMWVENAPDGTNSYFIEQFSNVHMNPPVSEDLFRFIPPAGVTMANTN